ncbi:MAG TPA: nuclear transport factor 2 family protein [Thermoanaerobaculia bacterium]|nr:nuclear transport factor 2 family protein [Thermoanaerobaculia bacterium]
MKKIFALLSALLLFPLLAPTRVDAQPRPGKEASDELFRTISSLDAEMFDAYNRCDLEKIGTFFTEDLEFYHDQTGLSRGRQAMVDAVKQNICGKVRRDLEPGTLEVYPLKGYGAVEIGEHRFCDPKKNEKCVEGNSGIAKFVMLWQNQDGKWKITRVISYDHVSSHELPARK